MTNVLKFLLFNVLIAASSAAHYKKYTIPDVDSTLHDELDRATRQAECCKKNMRCCHKNIPQPNIELRAVIARCIAPTDRHAQRKHTYKHAYIPNECMLKSFTGYDEDEPLVQSQVTKCDKKVILTMKISNMGPTNTRNQFIIVDHAYDPFMGQTVRMLNPYVIKLKQDHVSQTYALKFLDFVNSEAREQVYNKHDGNYTGCNIGGKSPTCGVVKYQGKIVPYSQGFCCSCDAQKNADRQPPSLGNIVEPLVGMSDPSYLMDSVQCLRTDLNDEKKCDTDGTTRINDTETKQNVRSDFTEAGAKHRTANTKNGDEDVGKYKSNFNPDNNYKIQSMNDEYEDQIGAKDQSLDVPSKKKYKSQKYVKKMAYNNPLVDALRSSDDPGKNERHILKPSVHQLLEGDNGGKSGTKHNFYDYAIQRIADDAFKAAINNDLKASNGSSSIYDGPEEYARISKRQVGSSGVQRRGGQNCADRFTPSHLNPESYHESTHCLRFSPVWYGVYRLSKPVVEQEVHLQIFQKYETETGVSKWKDITHGKPVKLGTFTPFFQDEIPTISFMFNARTDHSNFCLDYEKLRLLIPEGLTEHIKDKYPEARGGPSEYLLLNIDKLAITGDECDKCGVGFEAFFRQPNRCSKPRSTCLHHQPKHMWLHDKKAERLSTPGCYFLKNFAKLSDNPVKSNASSDEKYLKLNYYGKHVTTIDMEINADFNAAMRPQSVAVITEVYIDSTSPTCTHLIIKVTNAGLLSSNFKVRMNDCPLDLGIKFVDLHSDLVMISPQNQHIFKLKFNGELDMDIFYCSVEVINVNDDLVALRRIRVQKFDRCICTWHCLCACVGSSKGLKCVPMKIEHYHAAGFQSGLPVISYVEHLTLIDDIVALVFYIFSFIFFTLFILGLTKALIGLCCVPVGIWGLNVLLDLPKPMKKYYEKRLRDREVVYDDDGWPINPDTKDKVRNLPLPAEFCANVMFFYTYPAIVMLLCCKRLCCPFYTYETPTRDRSKHDWFKGRCSDRKCPNKDSQAGDSDDHADKDKNKKDKDTKDKNKKDKDKDKDKDGKDKDGKGKDDKGKDGKGKDSKSKDSKGKDKDDKKSKSNMKAPSVNEEPKKKPTIKVSIREHPRTKPEKKSPPKPPPPSSTTDDGSSYTSSTPTASSRRSSSKSENESRGKK